MQGTDLPRQDVSALAYIISAIFERRSDERGSLNLTTLENIFFREEAVQMRGFEDHNLCVLWRVDNDFALEKMFPEKKWFRSVYAIRAK